MVIYNARVVDGTGQPWFTGWVAVRGDRISGMGRGPAPRAHRTVDAGGLALSPGFIDIHTHTDGTILLYPEAESALLQGVTTHVGGNCGSSLAPVPAWARERMLPRWEALGFLVQVSDRRADPDLARRLAPYFTEQGPAWETVGQFLDLVGQARPGINFGMLVGHGTVRLAVVGEEARPPAAQELAGMESLVAQAVDEGALGMSTGLIYAPGIHAGTDEIVQLARAVASRGGIYTSHIRGEGETLEVAVSEAMQVGREAGVPVQISHHKATGEHNWGKVRGTLEMVDRARAEGVDVTLDQYPYTATSTGLTAFLPPWAHEGGVPALLGRLADSGVRQRLERDMREGLPGWTSPWRGVGFERVLLVSVRGQPELNGLTIARGGPPAGCGRLPDRL
ncbi:MAG: amidohydrolase family protein [Bacillota bacterium]|nr:amidohydrolase family protein [Bacillota bacterium]